MTDQRNKAIGTWIPLMEFAMKRNISLSTLRRHIKNGKVTFKIEGGRYLLWDNEDHCSIASSDSKPSLESVSQLEKDLKQAQEEIAELKTLIALYEEYIPPQFNV